MKQRSLWIDFSLYCLTLGLWFIPVNMRKIFDLNDWYKKDQFSVSKWFLLSVLSLGFYHCYHQCRLTHILEKAVDKNNHVPGIIFTLLATLTLFPLADLYHQNLLNQLSQK